jgi:hypothetical protein
MLLGREVECLGQGHSLSVEDLEMDLRLHESGVRPAAGPQAVFSAPTANTQDLSHDLAEDAPPCDAHTAPPASPVAPQSPSTFIGSLKLPLLTPLIQSPPRVRVTRDDSTPGCLDAVTA